MDIYRKLLFAGLAAAWILTGLPGTAFAQSAVPPMQATSTRYSRAETLDLQIEIERLRKAFDFFREDRDLALEELTSLQRENARLREQIGKLEASLKKKQAREGKKTGGLIGQLMAQDSGGSDLSSLQEELKQERRMRRHFEAQVREMELALAKFRQDRLGLAPSFTEASATEEEVAGAVEIPAAEPAVTTPVPAPEPAVQDKTEEPPVVKAAAEPAPALKTPSEPGEDMESLMANGEKLLGEGKVDEALAVFSVLLERDPVNARAMMGMASCYYNIWDFKNAESMLNRLLDLHPTYAEALGLKGMISWRNGELEKADRYLSRGLLLDPQSAQLHNYMGIVHHSRQRLPEAATEFRKAVELDPGHAEARFNLAVVLATSTPPEMAEARKYYESAISLGSERNQDLEKILYP